jgi:hypothetical protein
MSISRRDLIAGGAVALVGAPAIAEARTTPAGIAPEARESIGVIGTILQDGPVLTGFGWVTQVAGLRDRDLFTDPAQRGAGTARLRWHAVVHVAHIDVLPTLFFGTGSGRLRFFFDRDGGAVPDQPDSFANGKLVARYTGTFRNIQIVYAPDHAVTEIIGELEQRVAHTFTVGGRHRRLGRRGLVARLDASGPAVRTEPTIPRSTRYVAGGLTIPH